MSTVFDKFNEERRVINENLDKLLTEIDPGSDYGSSLGDIFLTPVKDAGKIISTDLKRLTVAAKDTILKTVNSVMSYLSAGYIDDRLDEIDNATLQQLDEILNDPDYRRAWEIVEPHVKTSIGKLSFMTDPVRYLTIELVKRSPGTAWSLTSLFLKDFSNQLPKIGSQIDNSSKFKTKKYEKLLASLKEAAIQRRAILNEISQQDVVFILQRPEIQTLLKKSPHVLRMKDEALFISENVRDRFIAFASEINNLNSLDDLTQKLKVPPSQLSKIDDADKSIFLSTLKQKLLERIAASLAKNLNSITDLTQDNIYFKTLKDVSERISKMMR